MFRDEQLPQRIAGAGTSCAARPSDDLLPRLMDDEAVAGLETGGGPVRVRVMDLGIAKDTASGKGLALSSQLLGTPYSMSPEQAGSTKRVDLRADVYSLGAALYSLVCGVRPDLRFPSNRLLAAPGRAGASGRIAQPKRKGGGVSLPALALVVLLCLLGATGARGQLVTRVYDIRDLTQELVEPQRQRLGLVPVVAPQAKARGAAVAEDSPERWIDGGMLQNLVRDSLDRDQWEGEQTIRYRDGRLLVHAPGKTQAQIATLLASLRRKLWLAPRLEQNDRATAMVRARLLAPREADRGWFARQAGGPLDGEALATARKLAAADEPAAELSVTGALDQLCSSSSLTERPYVAGFGPSQIPEVRTHRGGATLAVRVLPAPGGRLALDLRFDLRSLTNLRELAAGRIKLQLPDDTTLSLRRKLRLPDGGGQLVALSGGRYLLVEAWRGRVVAPQKK